MKRKLILCASFLASITISYAQSTIDKDAMKLDVETLADDKMEGRGTGRDGEKLAADYITGRFEQQGLTPKGTDGYFQDFTFKPKNNVHANSVGKAPVDTSEVLVARNVVGYIDNNAENTIVIGAHYDHLGFGENGSNEIHNGADDNASGVASIIQLAKILKEKNKGNNYLFIAFSGEEHGLLGSKYFVENPTIDIKKVNYLINLDMVGRLQMNKKMVAYGTGTSPVWNDLLSGLAAGKFHLIKKPEGVGPSDHTSFYNKNIPVLSFFTGQHSDYHKPTDDVDKVNVDGMVEVVNFIDGVITGLDGKEKLAFTETKNDAAVAAPAGGSKYRVTLGIEPDYMNEGNDGVHVEGVKEGRPGEKAGMKKGDVIVKMGDLDVKTMRDYMGFLGKHEKGDKVVVVVNRDGKKVKLKVVL